MMVARNHADEVKRYERLALRLKSVANKQARHYDAGRKLAKVYARWDRTHTLDMECSKLLDEAEARLVRRASRCIARL